jgi:iron complex outermembrane receptor protein
MSCSLADSLDNLSHGGNTVSTFNLGKAMIIRVGIILLVFGLHIPMVAYTQVLNGMPGDTAEDVAAHTAEEPEVEYYFSISELVTIGVMEITGVGLPQEKADVIADIIAEHISKLGDVRVVSKADISSMLNLEKQKRLAGCTDKECFAEIAGVLGMPWMITGNVSILGKSIILNLKLIDVRNAYVAGRATRRIKGDVDDLLDELPEATDELFDRVAERLGLSMPGRVTIAARHVQPIGESPSAVWVITREDIEASGANTIPDLLRLVPGMEVMVVSPFFTALTARLYLTNENNHFLVMIDGREANVELLGQTPWEVQPIMLGDIERIEIIRGPGSSLYGANAVAGVISLTTRSVPEATSGWARIIGGEPGMLAAGARSSTTVGKWGFTLSAGADFSGAFGNPRLATKEVWKARSIAEYQWSAKKRLMFEASYSWSAGAYTTGMGFIDGTYHVGTLRAAYQSDEIRGHLYWMYSPVYANLTGALQYNSINLADFVPTDIEMHTVDGEVQWTLPKFWDPLLVIVGAGGRFSYIASDQLLDAETFADITSPRYHEAGVSHWEARGSTFVHAELSPTEWVTATFGARLDYNTETEIFLSPRLAAVFRPVPGQFIRLGVARAFRKPAYFETGAHPIAKFPPDSPITGDGQDKFLEFLTRVGGNNDLTNEELLSFEAGYLGQFLDGTLSVSLDLYYNLHTGMIGLFSNVIPDRTTGLPDLDRSSFMFGQDITDLSIIGSELSVRYSPSKYVSLLASWTHREVFDHEIEYGKRKSNDKNPKNLLALGGRFRTPMGLLGSLYAYSRSEFWDTNIENPEGLLEEMLTQHRDNVLLLLGKIGWRWETLTGYQMETGVKLFLPVSPFSKPHFRYYEKGGGISPTGVRYGGQELARMVTGYLQGSF